MTVLERSIFYDVIRPSIEKLWREGCDITRRGSSENTSEGAVEKIRPLLELVSDLTLWVPKYSDALRCRTASHQDEKTSYEDMVNKVDEIRNTASIAAESSLTGFLTLVESDSMVTRHIPKDASVVPITSTTCNFIRRVFPWKDTIKFILQSSRFTQASSSSRDLQKSRSQRGSVNVDVDEAEPAPMQFFVRALLEALRTNLEGKSYGYSKTSPQFLPHLFLVNNLNYIIKSVQESEKRDPKTKDLLQQRPSLKPTSAYERSEGATSLLDTIGSRTMQEFEKKLQQEMRDCHDLSWQIVLGFLDTSNLPEYEYASKFKNDHLTLETGRPIKAKWTGFNEKFQEMEIAQKDCSVPDEQIQKDLRKLALGSVLPAYKTFHEKLHNVPFSKKHMKDYVKFTPEDVEEKLNNFFI